MVYVFFRIGFSVFVFVGFRFLVVISVGEKTRREKGLRKWGSGQNLGAGGSRAIPPVGGLKYSLILKMKSIRKTYEK